MDDYEKLRGLLAVAKQIINGFGNRVAHIAQHDFAEMEIPAIFRDVVFGEQEVPTVELLRESRPAPQHVFDIVVLRKFCERMVEIALSPEGYWLTVEIGVEVSKT